MTILEDAPGPGRAEVAYLEFKQTVVVGFNIEPSRKLPFHETWGSANDTTR